MYTREREKFSSSDSHSDTKIFFSRLYPTASTAAASAAAAFARENYFEFRRGLKIKSANFAFAAKILFSPTIAKVKEHLSPSKTAIKTGIGARKRREPMMNPSSGNVMHSPTQHYSSTACFSVRRKESAACGSVSELCEGGDEEEEKKTRKLLAQDASRSRATSLRSSRQRGFALERH
jgi:hypothetical protein